MKESIFARAKKARENKKGFTLVELIVVLVILAILAAILVPALLGWIDKAKEKQIVVNARTAYMACQTVLSEDYATKTPKFNDGSYATNTVLVKSATDLAQLGTGCVITSVDVAGHKVTGMVYTESGKTATLASTGEWTVAKTTP